jgi:glycerol-3-phosphate acyltransferase PlsX
VQFAVLGEAFARTALGINRPSVGLLNVGSEEQKGKDYVRQAAAELKATTLPIHFYGFVEGNDIPLGTVDVIVTDGFSGNIALKTAEGTARLYATYLKRAMKSSIMAQIGYLFARRMFNQMREKMDPRKYNGAVFLGLDGVVVKSHGGTDAVGFANAIGVAVDMIRHGFIETVRGEFAKLSHHLLPTPESVTEAV